VARHLALARTRSGAVPVGAGVLYGPSGDPVQEVSGTTCLRGGPLPLDRPRGGPRRGAGLVRAAGREQHLGEVETGSCAELRQIRLIGETERYAGELACLAVPPADGQASSLGGPPRDLPNDA